MYEHAGSWGAKLAMLRQVWVCDG